MRTLLTVCVMVAMCGLLIVGCGGKGADETKSVADCKAEAAKMDTTKLHDTAMAYKQAAEARQAEVKSFTEKLKAIPLTEMTGDKAKALKGDVDKATASLKALTERLQVYVDELKTKGGDIKGLTL